MEALGRQVRLREVNPMPLPARLESVPGAFALQVALSWQADHPGAAVLLRKRAHGADLETPHAMTHPTVLRQMVFTDDDVMWYLKTTQTHANPKVLLPLVAGNLELVPQALAAAPHWDYFLSTLKSGDRMRKPVEVVQPCIQLGVYNFPDSFPVEVVTYVLHHTPEYGLWLEQHVTKFYELYNYYREN